MMSYISPSILRVKLQPTECYPLFASRSRCRPCTLPKDGRNLLFCMYAEWFFGVESGGI